jgi:hypothetical protein
MRSGLCGNLRLCIVLLLGLQMAVNDLDGEILVIPRSLGVSQAWVEGAELRLAAGSMLPRAGPEGMVNLGHQERRKAPH